MTLDLRVSVTKGSNGRRGLRLSLTDEDYNLLGCPVGCDIHKEPDGKLHARLGKYRSHREVPNRRQWIRTTNKTHWYCDFPMKVVYGSQPNGVIMSQPIKCEEFEEGGHTILVFGLDDRFFAAEKPEESRTSRKIPKNKQLIVADDNVDRLKEALALINKAIERGVCEPHIRGGMIRLSLKTEI